MGTMNIKVVDNSDSGDADHVGGDDWDQVADILNGTYRITSAGNQGIEFGPNTVAGGDAFIDFHTDSGDGDYRARLRRGNGADADFDITNTGVGDIDMGILKVGPNTTGDAGLGVRIALPTVDTSTDSDKNFKITQTISATAATAVDYKPIDITQIYLADDVSSRHDLAACGLHIRNEYGSGSVDAKGTIHALTLNTEIKGSENYDNEIGNLVTFFSTAAEAASMWGADLNLHGPVAVQPGLLVGISQFINNYYNGSPTRNTSAGIGLYTKQGSGGGALSAHSGATTYPVDLGLIICGTSGNGTTNVFTTGIQVGGFGGAWITSGSSKIGTGIKVFDCFTNAIDLSSQTQSDLSGFCLKLPNDGTIGRSSTGNLSFDSSDNLTVKSTLIKTVGAQVGNTDSVHYVAGHRPDIKKYGSYYGSSPATGSGLLDGRLTAVVVGAGPPTNTAGTADSTGIFRVHDTSATINNIAGWVCGATLMTRINNAYFKTNITTGSSVANTRIFAGLVASSGNPASAADPLNALAGVALWYDSAVNANWRRLHNDNSGASVSDDTTLGVNATTNYTVEIEASGDTKFVFRFNGTSTDISTDIPGSTTPLGFWIYIENTTGASRTMKSYYIIIRSDK